MIKESLLVVNMFLPEKSVSGLINKFAENIHKGYLVYRIDFILDSIKRHYNVFINPETKQVVAENNAFLLPR